MVHTAPKNAPYKCPKCGSGHVDLVDNKTALVCFDCGYEGKPFGKPL